MSAPDVIVTAPLPPFLYDPLKRDFRTHDYYQSAQKPALTGGIPSGSVLTPTGNRRRT